MPSLAVEVKEEEVLVLDHRSANRAAELVHMERLAHNGARVVDPRVGVYVPVAQVLKRGAMEFVRAGFAHHVSDRAARSAELGRVAITVDLELFHRIDAELVGCPSGSGPAHGLAVKIVVVVNRAHLYVSKPLLLGGDLVFPNGEQSKRVKAASAGHGGSLQARVGVACGNLSGGNSGFGSIRDAAGNGSGQGLLSRGEEWDCQKKHCKVESSNHRLKTPRSVFEKLYSSPKSPKAV